MNIITINGHDISQYIVNESYQMDAEDQFLSWQDGNFTEHRIVVASKITGSFDIACTNAADGLTVSDLMDYLTSGADSNIAVCSVWVTNRGSYEAINAYYTVSNKTHDLTAAGGYVDVLTVELKER